MLVDPVDASATPTLYVLVGLPASGKTTCARELEAERHALRLTPDEWMISLFGEPEANGKRDVLEGRFIALAARALHLGTSVVMSRWSASCSHSGRATVPDLPPTGSRETVGHACGA